MCVFSEHVINSSLYHLSPDTILRMTIIWRGPFNNGILAFRKFDGPKTVLKILCLKSMNLCWLAIAVFLQATRVVRVSMKCTRVIYVTLQFVMCQLLRLRRTSIDAFIVK